jgi:hypothetical protein
MRVRVGLRAFHALKDKAALLNPFTFGLFAWQLWSHKVLRYMAFLFMAGALASNVILTFVPTFSASWSLVLAGQIVFYALALYGHAMNSQGRQPPRLIGLIYYLCVLNLASALAFWQFLQGRKQVTWKPRV